ncbi:MAG TPA: exopolyphosphatase [Clostridiales bacterium]|jgi:exopolyphosphatase/guanosine-5'-triphosphate,3'-diphosphate pyrophosphatase|nr:exopolyphosphatase [Clostridiales bacterium]
MKYGIIDIGSNTFRLIIAEIINDSYFVVDGFKESVRLSEGLDNDSMLSEEKLTYGLKTLKMLVNYCRQSGCEEIRVVGTAALRKANNRDVFIQQAMKDIDINVELLPGEMEAEYDYVGSINSINLDDYLFMDIGGGSTELGLIKKRKLKESVSLPFGAVDLAEKYNLKDKPDEKDVKKLEKFLTDQYKGLDWLKEAKKLPLVGIGGTIREIGKIQKRKSEYPLSAIHNYQVKPQELDDIYKSVSTVGFKERCGINGLGKDRADIFVGACGAVRHLVDYLNSDSLIISRDGLREGLLYEKMGYGIGNVTSDPLVLSVENMLKVYDIDYGHASHVLILFRKLFNELSEIHQIKENVDDIIYTASMLHDVGKLLDYKNHHEHTFYIMLNSLLSGISHKKQLMAAIVAGNHTDSKLKINLDMYTRLLTKEELQTVDRLSILMKLAEGLDRGLSSKVKDIMCRCVDKYVIIKTINYDDISLEIAYLRTLENDFENTFKLKMIIV